jgi:glucose uptake protein GlcU
MAHEWGAIPFIVEKFGTKPAVSVLLLCLSALAIECWLYRVLRIAADYEAGTRWILRHFLVIAPASTKPTGQGDQN